MGALGLAVALGAGVGAAQTAGKTADKELSPDQVQWGKAPPGMPTSIQAAVLDGDPSQPGWFIVRLRLPDGAQIRPHWHSQDEHVTVLSGHFGVGMGETWSTDQMRDLPPSSYLSLPAGHRHFAVARGETIVEVSGMGPFDIHYINPKDDPRNQGTTLR
jgi:quercetin dioxygenase-like cupin family protein